MQHALIARLVAGAVVLPMVSGCSVDTTTQSDSEALTEAQSESLSPNSTVLVRGPTMFTESPLEEAKAAATDTGRLVVVDLTASWCPPCQHMETTTWVNNDVAAWIHANAIALKIDVDKQRQVASDLGVRSIPTIIIYRDGAEFDRASGYQGPKDLLLWLQASARGERRAQIESRMPTRWTRLAPFTGVRWSGGLPEIEHEEQWYALVGVDGIAIQDIINHCHATYPGLVEKRFSEDLVEVMAGMGARPGTTVDLQLRRLDTGEQFTAHDVAMSAEKRRRAWMRNNGSIAGPSAAAPDWAGQNPFFSGAADYPNWSAFSAISWKDGASQVEVNGRWYALVSFHGIASAEIVEFCKQNYGGRWQMRFEEDLVVVVRLMGRQIDKHTDLVLRDGDEEIEFKDFPMTEENLRSIMLARGQRRNPFLSSVPDYPRWSAFSAISWEDGAPQVEVNGRWYALVSFHGIPSAEIVEFCQQNYGGRWQMRFEEDLVVVIRLMGHQINRQTDLVLRDGDEEIEFKDFPMTEENLRSIMRSN